MNADAETSKNEGIRTTTEDTQPHLAGNTDTCTLDYSELLGIMKQMQKSTTAQAEKLPRSITIGGGVE